MDLDVTAGTSDDQVAIAPGDLVREWRENGRHYFQYKTSTKIADFFSEVLTLGVIVGDGDVVLVHPDREVPLGAPLR